MMPRYPVFVPTKGRYESLFTIKALEAISVPYKAVIEAQEVEKYIAAGVARDKILVLPHRDKGLVVTRNWIWDYAQSLGVKRFWTFDDNIKGFYRLNRNTKITVACATPLYVIEDFVERYKNIPIAGMNYAFFAKRKQKIPPFYLNTRVYSNMLIETNAKDKSGKLFRNEGFYNDDTDLCLRVLKDGQCTVLFNAFLILKQTTMTVKGGMTPHYLGDGRYKMAKELCDKHPDVARMSKKFGRYQHHVDYTNFVRNELIRKTSLEVVDSINEYGMTIEIDAATEEEFSRNRKMKQLNKSHTEFLHEAVQAGKSVDQAVSEWREYVAKSLETKGIENSQNSS